jgi:aminocarboxymuconate-semialdehyde decarboxylase
MPVIDVHTHMLSHKWLELLKTHAKRYTVEKSKDGPNAIFQSGAQFMTLQEGMFDYDLRIKNMNEAKVDIAVVTLTCPNVYWGGPEISLQAAKVMNDDMAAAQRSYPDRIRWMCSLPWEHTDLAVAELARACDDGAVGVMVLANINGRSLTEEAFAPVWKEIDRRALPVLVHPSTPPGADQMDAATYQLIGSAGFLFDTTLAFNRMILDGFFDRFPNLKLIASHGGGFLPYLAGRMDICYDRMPSIRGKISVPPSEYLRRIYYDATVYRRDALVLCLDIAGSDRVMYGSDYPHNIGDMKGCLSRVASLSAADAKAVRSENALRIFKI